MREVYLITIFLANLLSSYISFKQESYVQGAVDSIFFSTAIILFMNPFLHINWFVSIICFMYFLGIMTTYKIVPRWSTMYRGTIFGMGLYVLMA